MGRGRAVSCGRAARTDGEAVSSVRPYSLPASVRTPAAAFRFSLSTAESRARDSEALALAEDKLLGRLTTLLRQTGATSDDVQLLEQARASLSQVFLLVLLGEFNAGKTSFINVLLGDKILEEGVTPTTSEITRITYGKTVRRLDDVTSQAYHRQGRPQEVQLPIDWLRYVNVVDTPGTNAVLESHQKITEEFLPRCDFVVFLTSCDRPLSQSERAFLEKIRDWKKKLVVVLTKRDQLDPETDELASIERFVHTNLRTLLGLNPPVFAVSSRLAQRLQRKSSSSSSSSDSCEEADVRAWQSTGFAELFRFLDEQLDCDERARIKLESPLHVAQRLVERYADVVRRRADTLRQDIETLRSLEQQSELYQASMRDEFPMQLAQVRVVIEALQLRGRDFISRSFTVRNLAALLWRSSAFADQFHSEVVRDNARHVDQAVKHVCDWITSNNARQLKRAMAFLADASSPHLNVDGIARQLDADFAERRAAVLTRVTDTVDGLLNSSEQRSQADQLLASIKNSVVQTLVVEAGAASLAALFAASLLDLSGVGFAAVLAAAGVAWLPYKQRQVAADFHAAVDSLSKSIEASVDTHFRAELADAMASIRNSCAPFAAFIEAESNRLQRSEESMHAINNEINALHSDILASCDLPTQPSSSL